MEKGFLPLLDVWGLILGMLVTFSYAQVAMYVFGLCNIRPVKRSIMARAKNDATVSDFGFHTTKLTGKGRSTR